ncbi:E3 ubiquitin-protein ligase TTC3 [Thalassophryne amazonica]|uniref:E3 ubiquitin-protein ligase TTC3 n=1 Tax=Thalassophryne amazonica TaxID=390379 RepID=UPI001471BFB6|nr:E3 ubiquitin-protein ligase TTC3 [Thalassophryne amazonica]
MSDSDSESECGWQWEEKCFTYPSTCQSKLASLHPSEDVGENWSQIPLAIKKEAGKLMKMKEFWKPILLHPVETNFTTCWAVLLGLIDSVYSEDISLKNLHKIEILEGILRALEKGCLKKDQTRHVFWLNNKFNLRSAEVFEDALYWLERSGEPGICSRVLELGHAQTCCKALHLPFNEYARFIQVMATDTKNHMKYLQAEPPDWLKQKSEEMKKKGNESFQKNQYDDAVKYYSKAISCYPENHVVYGNRALCYIRSKKYLKAVGDGKRATLIDPFWAKGHYRYCEALFFLGEVKMAIDANVLAQRLCKDDHIGIKDLEQQHQKFIAEVTETKKGAHLKKRHSKGFGGTSGAELHQQPEKAAKPERAAGPAQQSKVFDAKTDKHVQPGKPEKIVHTDVNTKDSTTTKSELSSKSGKGQSSTTAKRMQTREQPKDSSQKLTVCKELRSLVQDAHTALADLRSRNAEQAFSQALALLETHNSKELGISTVDVVLLRYGRASALTEIGQPEELDEALKLLESIKSFEERTFQCLVFYAIGKVHFKENRFAVALRQFSDSLQMVKNQIIPGKLTWPLTKDVVKETQLDYFKGVLKDAIEMCKFPPLPDAICRLGRCLSPHKAEIFFNDPDFKGFIRMCCCQRCIVEYHISCWKTLKTSFPEKNEKDFLEEPCFTPDCVGQICSIKIFGSTGLVKCQFDTKIIKPQTSKKVRVTQKCTSLKNLKLKEERKLRRKQQKKSYQLQQSLSGNNLLETKDSEMQSCQKAWLVYRDPVLHQISQNMELLRDEEHLLVSELCSTLKPWLELDASRGSQLAERLLNQEQGHTLVQVLELLLERKNRVWGRVFIHTISHYPDINPKLCKWACQLDSAGLNAASRFMERHTEHLEQLDLELVFHFGPLQEMIIEKLGTPVELFPSLGLTVTEYFKQAPAQDMRLFIWTLEEHRDHYVSCHPILDEYFDIMDGHCSVLKKSDDNLNNSPMKTKNRGRKKKGREAKGVVVWTGMRNVTPREEWDQDFLEEDGSLSFLHPTDPFMVPSHLREQVADFEQQYSSTSQRSHNKNFLDNNPDPTKESLYDYFAQILKEHGPLDALDPLLVGELENFPEVAQLKIQESGGFERFLLESLRFIKMGSVIGLAEHAVSLQQAVRGTGLEDSLAHSPALSLDEGHEPAFTSYTQDYLLAPSQLGLFLPNPYGFGCPPEQPLSSVPGCSADGTFSAGQQYDLCTGAVDYSEQDYYCYSMGACSNEPEERPVKHHVAAQTCLEARSSVAVNTEVHQRFESSPGGINNTEKHSRTLKKQIDKIEYCDKVIMENQEDISSLQSDIEWITATIQVTDMELVMFQQKLEEEVKKDQREKKVNNEMLKTLKLEKEELEKEHERLSMNIKKKQNNYEVKLCDFLELSNQSAAKKMRLEEEIKHYSDLVISSNRRSHAAQLCVLESTQEELVYSLKREMMAAQDLLTRLDEVAPRFQSQDLDVTRNSCRITVQEVKKKIAAAEVQFQDQLDQVKKGKRMTELPPLNGTNMLEPAFLSAGSGAPQSSVQTCSGSPALSQHSASTAAAGEAEPKPSTVFDRAMDRLTSIFPDCTRTDLVKFVQELRSSAGGSLSSLALEDVVSGVTQLILDQQENLNSGTAPHSVPPAPVWQPLGPQRSTHSNALNVEDPCIICHDDMSPEDTCVLECRHGFHRECIRSWLKEQSTCPTCRDHALLPEDFPALCGRRRNAL